MTQRTFRFGKTLCVLIPFLLLSLLIQPLPGISLRSLADLRDAYSVYHVAPNGDCGGQLPCYASIQEAVEALDGAGELIKVAAGTYSQINDRGGDAQVVYIDKALTLRGGYALDNWDTPDPVAHETVIDPQGAGRGIVVRGARAVIEGLRVTGGDATGFGGWSVGSIVLGDCGGGIYAKDADLHLANCELEGNLASSRTRRQGYGGGLFALESWLAITNCTILSNTASNALTGYGGGLAAVTISDTLVLRDSLIRYNVASTAKTGYGGGVSIQDSTALLRDNEVLDNVASGVTNGSGGGVYIESGMATLQGNTISRNVAGADAGTQPALGGGLYAENAALTLHDNTLADNVANGSDLAGEGYGGGLFLESKIGPLAIDMFGNAISGNVASRAGMGYGGGMYLRGMDGSVENNTLLRNTAGLQVGFGGGLFLGPDQITPTVRLTLTNNLVQENTAAVAVDGFGGGIHMAVYPARYDPTNPWHSSGSTVGAEVLLDGNRVLGNTASQESTGRGGGISLSSGTIAVKVLRNTVRGNAASRNPIAGLTQSYGGGLHIGGAGAGSLIEGNLLEDNIASAYGSGFGGGISVDSTDHLSTLRDNTLRRNVAGGGSIGYGGGIGVRYADADLEGNELRENVASSTSQGFGGGVCYYSSPIPGLPSEVYTSRVTGNVLIGNVASQRKNDISQGGGLWAIQTVFPTMTNNIIAANRSASDGSGEGLHLLGSGQAVLTHNTIADNGSRGLVVGASYAVDGMNNIIAGHTITGTVANAGAQVTLTRTLWYDNSSDMGGAGTVTSGDDRTGNPAFVSPAGGNYHIGVSSAAIDAGIPLGLAEDIDGQPRPCGEAPDIGADEQCGTLHQLFLPMARRR